MRETNCLIAASILGREISNRTASSCEACRRLGLDPPENRVTVSLAAAAARSAGDPASAGKLMVQYRHLWQAAPRAMPPEGPSLGARAVHLATAIARWAMAGCPTRTDGQVTEILETHCTPCRFYRDGVCRHHACGCHVNLSRWQNKLRWATESCPIGLWGNEISEGIEHAYSN